MIILYERDAGAFLFVDNIIVFDIIILMRILLFTEINIFRKKQLE